MTSQQILAWAIAHPELAVVAAGALLSIPGAIYAVVKTAFQAITGRAAKGRVWTTLDVIVEVLPNLPGAINRAVRGAGLPSIFAPPSAPTPPSNGQSGRAHLGALVVLLVVGLGAGALLQGCPRPRDCTPASQRCEGDTPVICDGEGRSWRASGDPVVTCAQVGGVCTVRDGRAYCAAPLPSNPFVDGGVR